MLLPTLIQTPGEFIRSGRRPGRRGPATFTCPRGSGHPAAPRALPYLHDEAVHAAGSALGGRVLPDGSPGHPHRPEDQRVGDEDEEAGEKVAEDEEGEDVERGLPARGFPRDAASCPIRLGAVAAPLSQGGRGKHQGVCPDAQQQHSGVAGRELVACGRGIGVRMVSHGRGAAERGAVTLSCPHVQAPGAKPATLGHGWGHPGRTGAAAHSMAALRPWSGQSCASTHPRALGHTGILLSPWVGGQSKAPRGM